MIEKLKLLLKSFLTFFQITPKNYLNKKTQMKINEGFKIDKPDIFIPWGTDEQTLKNLFKEYSLKRVTTGYYTAECISLGELKCIIGFHFDPRLKGKLIELEFFRIDYNDQRKSFNEFQHSFEKVFGQPTSITKGNEGFNNYQWLLNEVQIIHHIYDRFGPEEHMRIRKNN